ncbi:hypothetical protein M441DRAFT_146129, partial [Trichoderma asperellum CBS 433.97]
TSTFPIQRLAQSSSASWLAVHAWHYSPFDVAASNMATGLASYWLQLFVMSCLGPKVAPRLQPMQHIK